MTTVNGMNDILNGSVTTSVDLTSSVVLSTSSTRHIPLLARWWLRQVVVTPDWQEAYHQLTWAWFLHIYGLACLFFLLAFYTFFSILNLRAQLSSRPFMATINTFLCVLGSSRAMFFLIDPYNSKRIFPDAISAILWDLAFPCLVSAFSLVQLAFFQLTQLRLGPSRLRSKSCLSMVISIHFCLVIAINIMWSFRGDLKLLKFGMNSVFCCWTLFLCISFLLGGWRTMKLLKILPPIIFPRSDSGNSCRGLHQLGLLAKCNNLASVAAAAAGPALVMPPKIRITDENEYSYSYISDTSHADANVSETVSSEKTEATPKNCNMDDNVSSPFTPRSYRSPHISVRFSTPPATILSNGSAVKEKKNKDVVKVDDEFCESSLLGESSTESKPSSSEFHLSSVLNHIAFVDNAMDDIRFDGGCHLKPTRRSQIEKLLQATCSSALICLIITICQLYNMFGPYGLCSSNERPSPWPWFTFHTIFRLSEFLMGCVMANITKRQVNRHHYPYSSHLQHHDDFD